MIALNRSVETQITARYAAFWHTVTSQFPKSHWPLSFRGFLIAESSRRNRQNSQTLAFYKSQRFSTTKDCRGWGVFRTPSAAGILYPPHLEGGFRGWGCVKFGLASVAASKAASPDKQNRVLSEMCHSQKCNQDDLRQTSSSTIWIAIANAHIYQNLIF